MPEASRLNQDPINYTFSTMKVFTGSDMESMTEVSPVSELLCARG